MKILFVVPYIPNLVRTRPYNLLRHLAQHGHQITLLTVWANEQERADLDGLRDFCEDVQAVQMPVWRSLWNSLQAAPGKRPLQSVYSFTPELVAHFNGTSPFDVVHVEHLRGSRYGLYLKQHTQLPVVWDSVDCISHLFEQAAAKSKSVAGRVRSWFELPRTRRFEGWLVDQFDHVLVTSPTDKRALTALRSPANGATPITVLPNGVDINTFVPDETVVREPDTLVVSGKMSYHANVSMVMYLMQEIMPRVWAQRPETKLWIVGKDPTREIVALADDARITVTGMVPEIRPYLQRATIAVTPIVYGAGIQNKVLEAMACATPVVTTPQAISAIQVTPGQDLLVGDTPEAFATQIVTLLADPAQQRAIGAAARRFVETHHDWYTIASNLTHIYETAVIGQQPVLA